MKFEWHDLEKPMTVAEFRKLFEECDGDPEKIIERISPRMPPVFETGES